MLGFGLGTTSLYTKDIGVLIRMQKKLVDKFLAYEKNYWNEIINQLKGPLIDKIDLFPSYYQNAGNLLIFPAKDGLVAITFAKGFKFEDSKFNKLLQDSEIFKGPFASIVSTSLDDKLSFTQWVQILTGNIIKISIDSVPPKNLNIGGTVFPKFPSLITADPKTGLQKQTTLFNLDVKKKLLLDLGISLRNVTIEELDSGKKLSPFLWRQIDIYGEQALNRLIVSDARLRASREIIGILAGLNMGLRTKDMSSSPVNPVIQNLQKIVNEFEALLEINGGVESEIQKFLNTNPILIYPDYIRLIPQAKLGIEYVTDYIFVKPTDFGHSCILVELENASHKLFNQNGDLSAPLRHSIKQVSDWRTWLRSNSNYAKESLNLKNLHSDSKAIIIIGRRKNIEPKHFKFLEALTLDHHYQTEILTYDDLIDKTKQFIDNLKELDKYNI